MRNTIRGCFVLIFIAILSLQLQRPAFAQDTLRSAFDESFEVRLSTEVDKLEVPRNRLVTFTAKLEWSGNIDRFELVESRNPDVENFEIIKNAQAHQTELVNGVSVSRTILEFTLKPIALGMGYVGDMPIRYRDKLMGNERQLLSNQLGVKVIEPVAEPGSLILFIPKNIFYLILAVIFAVAAIAFALIKLTKNRALARKHQEELAAIVPLEEQYLTRLKADIDLNAADIRSQFSLISRIYREYLAEKYQLPALEATTPELKSLIASLDGNEKFLTDTSEILSTCDLVKFGGGQLSGAELARIYTLTESILEQKLQEARATENRASTS
ncbi:hypothetical protein JXJ21_17985 [candidate division KSB1 bacterium]|nr:hypothetical protein [candidate division KSB1 bacterium]